MMDESLVFILLIIFIISILLNLYLCSHVYIKLYLSFNTKIYSDKPLTLVLQAYFTFFLYSLPNEFVPYSVDAGCFAIYH